MIAISVMLLAFHLACVVYGVIELTVYQNTSGLGVMVIGVLLYFGGELALTESRAVKYLTRG